MKLLKKENLTDKDFKSVSNFLKNGSVGVVPTDTIYGIVGSARVPETVERIYELRKREKSKPMIILISSSEDLEEFDIQLSEKQKEFLEKNWPNPLSVILPCNNKSFMYLHRGKNSLAFRMPKDDFLQKLLKISGPLVAPSANFEGEKPSENIVEDAKRYFGEDIDFYLDAGELKSPASTLIKINDEGQAEIIREGEFKVDF